MSKKATEIQIPTEAEVPGLTDRIAEINAELEKLTAEKKGLQERLEAYALSHPDKHEPLKDETREGRRFVLPGRCWHVPVVFSSDLIIGTFPDSGKKHKELLGILCEAHSETEAPAMLKRFFDAPEKWENRFDNGLKFRGAVNEWLPPKIAAKFIAACTQRDKHGVKKNTTAFDFKAATKVDGKVVA